jgi:enamine deaminase RidA (YjgF/YER057c/UK114 family)
MSLLNVPPELVPLRRERDRSHLPGNSLDPTPADGPHNMKTNIVETSGSCRLEIRQSERESFTDYFITATVEKPLSAAAAAEEVFSQVAAALVLKRIQPFQEKAYGLTGVRAAVLKRRDTIYRQRGLDRTMPVTWIQGTPLQGCDFAGVQIWGTSPRDGEACVKTVENPVTGRGRLWTGSGFRLLHLPSISGQPGADRVAQATQMFTNMGLGLKAHGMRFTNILRTWIYAARLLDWYSELNGVRTAIYRKEGLGLEGGPAFPASTGIMGQSGDEECILDVVALDADAPDGAKATPISRSRRQDSSFNYGSSFSRAMALEIEGRRTVFISGTASINSAGASTHVGDAEGQSLETLMCIAAILEEQGGGLKDIASATLFCKNREAWEAWERVTRLLGIPALPKVCVIADVCRHDLLVEMEAVAVI